MEDIILITGGARSGKSRFAENMAKESNKRVLYIATAISCDKDMKDRILKHKQSRPKDWKVLEKYKEFDEIKDLDGFKQWDVILLDCITLMVSNLLLESGLDFDTCNMLEVDNVEEYILNEIDKLLNVVKSEGKRLILVTNEVGMGLVPSYRLGNIFRDIAGRVNQYLAQRASEVYFTVSGIPMKIK
ncbi:bifunctional adenosylcobinamide kinase/adenosylcobinamide-phosphate guanylyltransferase [Caldisalinibacter kiritimatiensis]|uniref:Adenosylcobinamide kinase n=1 Tax=Caldisalinibacter kiritimatiensis TaxID=1304284 RepID=R1AUS2_9FIRM|nr:bifunctional adenosylcobinamide kinase/adenosylcobinamide-phosphate guanylyltransferase [Caldisalinibacter kiritimatiensis]EOD00387.1 Adenosylcobinamide-phosphate guanylyltransferase [Caldisalinibacter kiritimatiensis]